MVRATRVIPANQTMPVPADRIRLDRDRRHRRRLAMIGAGGTEFLLDLPAATVLHHGDGLLLEDGRVVVVEAEPEALLEIRVAAPGALTRLAWHLGNRHLPTAIDHDRLLIRRDYVIADMLKRLGAEIREVTEPFDPEGGAYDGGAHRHSHDHNHGHGHD